MPRRINQRKITTENIKDKSAKDSLEICEKNISELFRRTTVSKWTKSEPVSIALQALATRQKVNGLEVFSDNTNKPDSVRIFLRQKSEISSAGLLTGGGIWIRNTARPYASVSIFLLRDGVVIHNVTLGSYLDATALAGFVEFNHFCPPNSLDFTDLEPTVGISNYTVEAYVSLVPTITLSFVDVELVAQKFY